MGMADWVPGPATVAVAALLAGLVVGTTAGTAATPRRITDCRTITEPGAYDLTANVSGSADTSCLRIETSNVTLDGHGHAIRATQASGTTGTGVLVASADGNRLQNVTVRDLRVSNWETGVAFRDVNGGAIRDVTATESRNGLVLTDSSQVTVRNVTAINNEGGVLTRDVTDSTFRNVLARYNAGTGLYTSNDFDGNRLVNVVARANRDDGIRLGPAWNTVVVNATANGNGGSGLAMLDTGQVVVSRLTVSNNEGTGLDLTVVAGTRFETVTARNNTEAIYAAAESRNVTVSDLTIGPGGPLSLTAGAATVEATASPPPAPAGYQRLDPAITVTRADEGASKPVVTMTAPAQTQHSPSLWIYRNDSWQELDGVQFESGENSLTATVGNGIVAPMVSTGERTNGT
ncbi:MAG: right-handed parallel beta-helix repeat-containing protein [Halorientalis sp.]